MMSEMKHTPGPWVVDPCGDILGNRNTKDDNGLICAMCSDRKDEEGYANARLIAAAPDLSEAAKRALRDLAAIKKFAEWCRDSPASLAEHINEGLPSIADSIAALDAAIAKAE